MSRFKTRLASVEQLESRMLLSATLQVMGYLVDYQIANTSNTVFSENANGTIANDNVDWSALTQVNYFALLPNASGGKSNGGLQPTTDSGYDPSVQLPALVKDAHNHGVSVFVTVGGGDANAIADMDALIDTPSAFSKFAANLKTFCGKYGLAGIDLDWEPTGQAGFTVTKAQIDNYGKLIQTIKSADPGLKLTADALGDPIELSTAAGKDTHKSAFMLNATAVKYLDGINVEAYPVASEDEAEAVMQGWAKYISGGKDLDGNTVSGHLSQLQYGIDVASDDTSNQPPGVVEEKVDTTFGQGYGGLFVFELDSDTLSPSALSRIHSEITLDNSGYSNSIGGTITDANGNPVAGVTIDLNSSNSSIVMSVTTDDNGEYVFFDVPPGQYMIRQVLPPGVGQASPRKGAGICIRVDCGSRLICDNFIDTIRTLVD